MLAWCRCSRGGTASATGIWSLNLHLHAPAEASHVPGNDAVTGSDSRNNLHDAGPVVTNTDRDTCSVELALLDAIYNRGSSSRLANRGDRNGYGVCNISGEKSAAGERSSFENSVRGGNLVKPCSGT